MKKFKIKSQETILSERELPEFFKVGNLNYIKIVNEEIHINVNIGGLVAYICPEIRLKPNTMLGWFTDNELEEVSKDQWYAAYDETFAKIVKLGGIL